MNLTEYQKLIIREEVVKSLSENSIVLTVDMMIILKRLGFTDEYFNKTSPILSKLKGSIAVFIRNLDLIAFKYSEQTTKIDSINLVLRFKLK